jgi:hypothetical protein
MSLVILSEWWRGFLVVGVFGVAYGLACGLSELCQMALTAWAKRKQAAACGRMVCAWCVPMRDIGPAPGIAAGKVSHGMCPVCLEMQMAEVTRRFPARIAASPGTAPLAHMTCDAGRSADPQRTGKPRAEAAGVASN